MRGWIEKSSYSGKALKRWRARSWACSSTIIATWEKHLLLITQIGRHVLMTHHHYLDGRPLPSESEGASRRGHFGGP